MSSLRGVVVLNVMYMSKCKMCKKEMVGRSDKIFCGVQCKNHYHQKLRAVTRDQAFALDRILHRNRSILLEVLGKKITKLKVKRMVLVEKGFDWKYHTHYHLNSQGKIMHYVYDFGWMEFSDDYILIVRTKQS